MKNILQPVTAFLERLPGDGRNDPASGLNSLKGIALLACFTSLALTCLLASRAGWLLHLWWVRLLLGSLVPTFVAFAILRQSNWHREMTGAVRTLFLIGQACLIFAEVVVLVLIIVASIGVFLYRFGAFHY